MIRYLIFIILLKSIKSKTGPTGPGEIIPPTPSVGELSSYDLKIYQNLARKIDNFLPRYRAKELNQKNSTCELYHQGESIGNNDWIMIAQRFGRNHNYFAKSWSQFKEGFGDVLSNYWIGLEKIRELTRNPKTVRLEYFDSFDQFIYYTYSKFQIGDESSAYSFSIGAAVDGNINQINDIYAINNTKFHTFDKDVSGGCPNRFSSGFWFTSTSCSNQQFCPLCNNARAGGYNWNELRIFIK